MSNQSRCRCHGSHSDPSVALELGEIGQPPSLAEMEAALAQAQGDREADLEIAGLDAALAEVEELPVDIEAASDVTLDSVLALVERYPGLKITFSY